VIDPKILDNLANRLAATLPPGIKEIKQDAEKNFRAILQGAFTKLNLVTREEFDVQTAVLNRANAKVQELERQVREMEARMQSKEPGVSPKHGGANQQPHGF
jgi:BMFP domain-containing protein YqiC